MYPGTHGFPAVSDETTEKSDPWGRAAAKMGLAAQENGLSEPLRACITPPRALDPRSRAVGSPVRHPCTLGRGARRRWLMGKHAVRLGCVPISRRPAARVAGCACWGWQVSTPGWCEEHLNESVQARSVSGTVP